MDAIKKLDRSLKGRGVLVTGAASGMGRATAHVFAQEGALVAVTDINDSGIARVVDEIKSEGGNAHGWRLDVMDHADIKRVVAEVADRFGRLDILINNAGFGAFHPVDGPEYDRIWDRAIAGLLTAQQRLVRAALPYLRKSDAARIVNIASTEGLGATPGDTPYVVAKTGVIGLTRGLAVDLGPEGITVNCICPGTDSHRADRVDSGRAQDDFRQAAHRIEALWFSRRGRAHHGQPVSSGGVVSYGRGDSRRWRLDDQERLRREASRTEPSGASAIHRRIR